MSQPDAHAVRLARAYLLRVAEPPAVALARLVGVHGPVRAAELVQLDDVPEAVRQETGARARLELAERDLADAAAAGGVLLTPEDPGWPAWALLALDVAAGAGARWAGQPIGLWVRGTGSLDGFAERAVAMVGARACTGYGEYHAAELAHGLVGRGFGVVSGAAYGIDGAAHRGAIAAGGPTVAVLGCGLDVGYPAGHVRLLDQVAEHGLVISEYPPGTPPARHRFLVRNRLIAALAAATLVIEAGVRSGARNTAATAGALGKPVMALPGPASSAMSVGCHQLIRAGDASLVSTVAEIAETVGPLGMELPAGQDGPDRVTDRLDPVALRVHEALGLRTGHAVERIASDSGVPVARVRAVLPALELDGLAQRCAEGWRRSSPRQGRGDA
ncbi:MAG: DNA-protecting protein DprA [Pseudonocardiaceae bacterium]|nr:DNA-protecting protein DprA [Pseudonocardiaceae bacterium]